MLEHTGPASDESMVTPVFATLTLMCGGFAPIYPASL